MIRCYNSVDKQNDVCFPTLVLPIWFLSRFYQYDNFLIFCREIDKQIEKKMKVSYCVFFVISGCCHGYEIVTLF